MIRRVRLVPPAYAARRGMLSARYRRRPIVVAAEAAEPAGVAGAADLDAPPGTPANAAPTVAARRPAYGHPTF